MQPGLLARTVLILGLIFVALPQPLDHSFTLEAALSAPFASVPVASPDGKHVVWLLNGEGKRNLWIASEPDWKGRALTSFVKDDGQELAQLSWSSDSARVYFTRGGDFENGGENPNPDLSLQTPGQAIWVASINGQTRRLTDGQLAAPRPGSEDVVFCRKGQLYWLQPDGKSELVVEDKGSLSQLAWSPDGNLLAFTSKRRGHSLIGLYSPKTDELHYPDPGTAMDSEPTWSPDGKLLAFLRQEIDVSRFGPMRTGLPWSIRVIDAQRSDPAREAFRAADGMGSVFRELSTDQQLFWLSDNRLVFPWERTRWLHLYSVIPGQEQPRELTPGDGEVEYAAVDRSHSDIYYSSNQGDLDRRHLWRISSGKDRAPYQVTSGESIEWEPTPMAGNVLIALQSSYRDRAEAVRILGPNRSQALAPQVVPNEYPGSLFVKPEAVLITATDGMGIHGQLFRPSQQRPGDRHPALLFFHGGSRRQMLLGSHYMYYYSNAYALNQFLASRGFLVLSVNYRSGIGYGLEFREALKYGPFGGSEYGDVVGAGLYLRSRPDVDPQRIGVWGGSYGGYLTAMALSRASDLFAAGVDFHGVHDWSTTRNFAVNSGDPALQERSRTAARVAFESSPMATVSGWRSPVLLIHGDDDRNVPFQQTIELAQALRRQGVSVQELIFPNEIHDFLRHEDWLKAYRAAADFFAKQLASHTASGGS